MDDDRTLAELAGRPLDDVDAATLEQVRFSFERLDDGFGQLSFRPVGDDDAANAVVTPLFQL